MVENLLFAFSVLSAAWHMSRTPADTYLWKLDNRSTLMVFIGYEEGMKAYCLYNPVTDRVCVSCDVIFEEDLTWSWGQEKG